MSENEIKAIENIKEMIELHENDCLITTDDDFESLKILLSTIEKQQKEIEDLKTITREYEAYKCEEGDNIVIASKKYFIDGFFEDFLNNYISKDKIREKIKEVENREENYTFDKLTSEDIRRTIITNLKELLGEKPNE